VKIAKGHTVRVDYELKVKGGDVLESSAKSGPLTYVHGDGRMLPALERQLDGLAVGAEKKGTIPAAKAYGDESVLPIKEIPRKEFPAGEKLQRAPEPLRDLGRRQGSDPGRRNLCGERHALQPAADLRHDRRVARLEREVWQTVAGPLHE
jgi:hypothetical protein